MISYSERLDKDPSWALEEGGLFFEGKSDVNRALQQITARLDALGIPYAVAGGMAVFLHGFRRFTEDVDLLIRKDDLEAIHGNLEGRGYLPKFRGSKNLRDTETGVSIEFLLAGEFPGDGRPKEVAFPDPTDVVAVVNGVKCIGLSTLIQLKITSGLSGPDRAQDLVDVGRLISALLLPRSFQEGLHRSVRSEFDRIWVSMNPPRRFVRILGPEEEIPDLAIMEAAGVTLEEGNPSRLVTTDAVAAARYGLYDEREFRGSS